MVRYGASIAIRGLVLAVFFLVMEIVWRFGLYMPTSPGIVVMILGVGAVQLIISIYLGFLAILAKSIFSSLLVVVQVFWRNRTVNPTKTALTDVFVDFLDKSEYHNIERKFRARARRYWIRLVPVYILFAVGFWIIFLTLELGKLPLFRLVTALLFTLVSWLFPMKEFVGILGVDPASRTYLTFLYSTTGITAALAWENLARWLEFGIREQMRVHRRI